MLNYVMELLPSPMDVEAIYGINPWLQINLQAESKCWRKPFAGLAFKIRNRSFS